jgi:hypothetical protein
MWEVLIFFASILWLATFGIVVRDRQARPSRMRRRVDRALHWIGFGFMGVAAITLFCFWILDFADLLLLIGVGLGRQIAAAETPDLGWWNYAPWWGAGVAMALSAWGFRTALRGPRIEHVRIAKQDLSLALRGFRIAQISDLHVSEMIRKRYVESVVKKTLELKPDLIAITGDIADGDPEVLREELEPLRALKARHGVFYITGNHEFYYGVHAWMQTMEKLGFHVLSNSHRIVQHEGNGSSARLLVSGIPDSMGARMMKEFAPDLDQAIAGAGHSDFHLFLAHEPSAYRLAEKAGCDLMLSGHTHSGQFFPVSWMIRFFHRYYRGLHRHGDFWIYVNRGTGFWGPPNRLGVPAEITLLELAA